MRALRVTVALALGFAFAVSTLAQETKPEAKPDPNVELLKLYRLPGTNWNYRVVNWHREGMAETVNEAWRVAKVEENRATVTRNGMSFSGAAWNSTEVHSLDSPTDDQIALAATGLVEETLDMGFAKFPCKKHVKTSGEEQTTSWVSTDYHPLVVKQVLLSPDHSEIRKLTAFQTSESDPWLLYRMAGRSWTIKQVVKVGDEEMVSYARNSVDSVGPDHAMLKMEMLDKDKKAMAGMPEPTPYKIEFNTGNPAETVKQPEAQAVAREKIKVAAGEFDCTVQNFGKTKIWMSAIWAGLTIKMEAESFASELEEFDLGHDLNRFYRAAGNADTSRTTTEIGGMKISTIAKRSVSKVEDGKATYTLVSLDQNGREIARNEMTMPVADKTAPLTSYSGQKEELVTTPAGTFPSIVTEPSTEQKVWMYHGMIVRMEMRNKQFTVITEITELKME
jgi:hypothetical protein